MTTSTPTLTSTPTPNDSAGMAGGHAATPLARARSFLFVPATRPDRYPKAFAAGADAVILDLEDAVGPGEKEAARASLSEGLARLTPPQRARTLVRINAAGTPWHAADLELLAPWAGRGLAGVMLPKAESPATLASLSQQLGAGAQLLPLVESLAGLDAADLLARVPGVVRLAFGHLDFQLDVGMRCGSDESPLLPVRTALVLASRRARLAAPVDGVTTDTADPRTCGEAAQRARAGGFGAKLCIHPAQVGSVNAAFSPSDTELAWARRALEAAGLHPGAFQLDGRMVDEPVLADARRLLAQAGPDAA